NNSDIIDAIWNHSKGLPLYLGLITANPNKTFNPAVDVVNHIFDSIPEKDDIRRKIAIDAALLSLPFTKDDLQAFGYIEEQDHEKIFHWLIEQSFVYSDLITG